MHSPVRIGSACIPEFYNKHTSSSVIYHVMSANIDIIENGLLKYVRNEIFTKLLAE
jgi:hypothetical protein